MVGLLEGQDVSLDVVFACTFGNVNKLTWSYGLQLDWVLESVQGVRPCSKVWTPSKAQWIRVLLQLASESLLPMEAVVSTNIATFTCLLLPAIMVAVAVVLSVSDWGGFRPKTASTLMK